MVLKFIYSENATKFCEIFALLLFYLVPVKSKVNISQNFVAFSECMNFTGSDHSLDKKPNAAWWTPRESVFFCLHTNHIIVK